MRGYNSLRDSSHCRNKGLPLGYCSRTSIFRAFFCLIFQKFACGAKHGSKKIDKKSPLEKIPGPPLLQTHLDLTKNGIEDKKVCRNLGSYVTTTFAYQSEEVISSYTSERANVSIWLMSTAGSVVEWK